MIVRVQYTAQLRTAVGRAEELVDLKEGSSLADLLSQLAAARTSAAPHLVTSAGHIRPSLLVTLQGAAVAASAASDTKLRDGDVVLLLPPIAGG